MSDAWVLITGASAGLGVEFARLAAAEGRNVILTARRAERLEALKQELMRDNHGIEIEVIPADLSQDGAAQALWDKASAGRGIDILVNNAGLGANGFFGDPDNWPRERAEIAVNVAALSALMSAAIGPMRARGHGYILNVASTAAFMPAPRMAVYHASKAYVLSLTEAVAEELSGSGVKVCALCPGPVATEFFEQGEMEDSFLLKITRPAPADAVARAGWTGMKRGRRIVVTGVSNKVFAFLPRLLPRRVMVFAMRMVWARKG